MKEHGCIYGWTNGTKSDNAISIQTMVTRTMATQKMVGRNMVSRNMVTPNMVGWNLVTPNMVCRNLVTLNMVTPKLLGTRLHRTQPYCGVQHNFFFKLVGYCKAIVAPDSAVSVLQFCH